MSAYDPKRTFDGSCILAVDELFNRLQEMGNVYGLGDVFVTTCCTNFFKASQTTLN